jgi:hypothetical protein
MKEFGYYRLVAMIQCLNLSLRTITDVIEKLSVLIALRNASESASGNLLKLLLVYK